MNSEPFLKGNEELLDGKQIPCSVFIESVLNKSLCLPAFWKFIWTVNLKFLDFWELLDHSLILYIPGCNTING